MKQKKLGEDVLIKDVTPGDVLRITLDVEVQNNDPTKSTIRNTTPIHNLRMIASEGTPFSGAKGAVQISSSDTVLRIGRPKKPSKGWFKWSAMIVFATLGVLLSTTNPISMSDFKVSSRFEFLASPTYFNEDREALDLLFHEVTGRDDTI